MATVDPFQVLKLVTLFNGEERELNNFINTVEIIADTLKDAAEVKKLLEIIIKAKVSESVRIKLNTNATPNTIAEFRILLQKHFQKKVSPLKIQNELSRTKQGDQTVQAFATKIENLISKINNMQIAEIGTDSSKVIKKLNDQTALNAFQAGLAEPFKTTVFAAMPNSFEEAIKVATQVEAVNDGNKNIFHVNTRTSNGVYQRNFRNNNDNVNYRNNYNHRNFNNSYNRNNNYNRGNSRFANHNWESQRSTGNRQRQYNTPQNFERRRNPQQFQQQNSFNNTHRQSKSTFRRYEARQPNSQNRRIRIINSENELIVPENQHSRDEE